MRKGVKSQEAKKNKDLAEIKFLSICCTLLHHILAFAEWYSFLAGKVHVVQGIDPCFCNRPKSAETMLYSCGLILCWQKY